MPRLPVALVLALLGVAIVSLDLALGPSGWPSYVFSALELLAVLPWAVVVLGAPAAKPAPGPAVAARSGERALGRVRALLANLVFVVLAGGALSMKALLLASAAGQGAASQAAATGHAPAEIAHLYRTYLAMGAFVAVLGFVGRGQRTVWFFSRVAERPARMLLVSITVAAMLGGFLLATPFALVDPLRASFVDALFDATGALTGSLAVSDVGRQYAPFGQVVILALMQIGGFGIMVLSGSVFLLGRRRLEVKSATRLAEIVDAESLADLRAMVRGIITWTIVIELAGAIALFLLFRRMPGIAAVPEAQDPLAGGGGPVWSAAFHSVSAFCNAGFSLFRGNLAPFVDDVGVNVVVSVLIVLGGLGFPVLSELGRRLLQFVLRRRRRRLSLHARVVLAMSGILIVAGAAPILALEWGRSFSGLSLAGKLFAALFQSITARTAGFSSVDLAAMSSPSLLVMVALMFIGAGPGSTGGGIKVTTFAVLIATFRAEQTTAPAPSLFARELPAGIQRKAIVVTFLSAVLVIVAVFLILVFEDQPPLFVLFDVTSAFGSVGCSTGIPARMGVAGKLLLVLTMLIGRIGPLTFALAAASVSRRSTYRLPEERVMIG